MGSFAVGHVCYLTLFGRGRARTRASLAAGIAYAVVLAVFLVLIWSDLPAELRVPVAGYSLLLTAMAWRAGVLGRYAAAGGALFLLSDTLIATGIAEWPQLPAPRLLGDAHLHRRATLAGPRGAEGGAGRPAVGVRRSTEVRAGARGRSPGPLLVATSSAYLPADRVQRVDHSGSVEAVVALAALADRVDDPVAVVVVRLGARLRVRLGPAAPSPRPVRRAGGGT